VTMELVAGTWAVIDRFLAYRRSGSLPLGPFEVLTA
jgi:hypothetical protein